MKKGNDSIVLLTGASGKLGSKILSSGSFQSIMAPSHTEFEVTNPDQLNEYLNDYKPKSIIHCAALARMKACQEDPARAIQINIIGTSNLIMALLNYEKTIQKNLRFTYISTDAVYASKTGNYPENGPTIPCSFYGWSKLGAECAVKLLQNHCIIRTRFFDKTSIPFDSSATDIFTSSMELESLVKAISQIHHSDFVGTINIGSEQQSDYLRYRQHKPHISPCLRKDIQQELNFTIAANPSMNCSLWKNLQPKLSDFIGL